MLKLSVARCASTSFKTVDNLDMTLERAVALYDKLLNSRPMHASPFEHQAQADSTNWHLTDADRWIHPNCPPEVIYREKINWWAHANQHRKLRRVQTKSRRD
jgi:hypothetical protein